MYRIYIFLLGILVISCSKDLDSLKKNDSSNSKLDSLIHETIISVDSKTNGEAIVYYSQFDLVQSLDSEVIARVKEEDYTRFVDRRLATHELSNFSSSDDFVIIVEAESVKYTIAPDTSEILLRDVDLSNDEIFRMKMESDVENFSFVENQFGEAILKEAFGEDYTEEEWENLGRALWKTYEVQETIENRALANDVYNSTSSYPLNMYKFTIGEDEYTYWVISRRAYTDILNKLKSFIKTYKNYQP